LRCDFLQDIARELIEYGEQCLSGEACHLGV
jgi:hypothetical protein